MNVKVELKGADGKKRTVEVVNCPATQVEQQITADLAKAIPWPDHGLGHADLVSHVSVMRGGLYQIRTCKRCNLRFDAMLALKCPKCYPET